MIVQDLLRRERGMVEGSRSAGVLHSSESTLHSSPSHVAFTRSTLDEARKDDESSFSPLQDMQSASSY